MTLDTIITILNNYIKYWCENLFPILYNMHRRCRIKLSSSKGILLHRDYLRAEVGGTNPSIIVLQSDVLVRAVFICTCTLFLCLCSQVGQRLGQGIEKT